MNLRASADYEKRSAEIQAELANLERRWNRVSLLRAVAFTACALLAVAAFFRDAGWWGGAFGAMALFIGCVLWHQRLGARRAELRRLADWYERSRSRLGGGRDPAAPLGVEFLKEDHPYAMELDLFGRDSLFSWICHAQSVAGRRCLSDWMLDGAPADEILQRQDAVAELRDDFRRREEMLLCAEVAPATEALHFRDWARMEAAAGSLGWMRGVSLLLAICLCASLAAWLGFGVTPAWFLLLSFAGYAWSTHAAGKVSKALEGLEDARAELRLLRRLLVHVERSSFGAAKLRSLHGVICEGATPASARITALERRLDSYDGARNALFAPVAALLLWRTQWACAIEAWRRSHALHLVGALEALAEYEALQSLARLAFECPTVRPSLLNGERAAMRFSAVGHPLLHDCVRNDVTLDAAGTAMWMISGSNMSGKSTLLRAVGVNIVLAMAGGHVLADKMEFTPVSLGASIRAGDSLSGGESRFAHELARLRRIISLSESKRAVCFLLDELLHGTHSHDRRIGADAILRRLARAGAIGLVTTHDLALCEIRPDLVERIRNVHFQDDVVGGEASFDYCLRDGIVQQSNALRLMRAAGLIDEEDALTDSPGQ